MRRRDFIAMLGGVAAVLPVKVRAQQAPKVHRIVIAGVASELSLEDYQALYQEPLLQGLHRRGYVEGKNVVFEHVEFAQNSAQLARDVIQRNPDVILAMGSSTAKALKEVTSTIPIVATTFDPVAIGLVSSLARPGGNITGVTVDVGMEVWGKRVQLLRAAVPTVSKLAILAVRQDRTYDGRAAIEKAAQDAHIPTVGPFFVGNATEAEYRRAFAAMSQEGADALIVLSDPEHYAHWQLIAALAEKHRIPAIYFSRRFVEAGGLLSYGFDRGELWRIVADEIDQILRGAKPGEIPFYQTTKFELIINLKTAKALGIEISPNLLAQADDVIE